jgi:pyruvate ferredoxin oxidoreductase gamma subunit
MVEIRWHARGGQGAKTAAMFLAEAVLEKGKYGQGFPEYGPERRGAPMRGFTRISETPIRRHCMIENPGIVIILDPTLLDSPAAGVTAGTGEGTVWRGPRCIRWTPPASPSIRSAVRSPTCP